jgi:uncharacterized membrane-anchored protein YjiN (DUF445 family)
MAATLTLTPAQAAKHRRLVVTKRRATSLLGVVTAVFLASVFLGDDRGWVGYVQATAEASMVGGLADWFAVTALFRHPLGIPIPHTAVVPERKDQFAETLGEFVQESFLTPDTIVGRVRSAGIGNRVAAWLAEPANAARAARHVVDGAVAIADLLRDDDVHTALEGVVREGVEAVALAPLAGRALGVMTRDGRHHDVLEAALRGVDATLESHREELRQRFGTKSPWWLPGAVEDRIFDRLVDGARAVLQQMAADPNDELRRKLDEALARLAVELATSPTARARGEQLKADLLAHPELRTWVATLWEDLKARLREQAGSPDSALRQRVAGIVAGVGTRLQEEPGLRASVDGAVETAVRYIAEQFHGEIADVVTTTIDRWDAEETANRLELLLGPDLQYIRINGTVVGGAAGLVLHAIATLG